MVINDFAFVKTSDSDPLKFLGVIKNIYLCPITGNDN